MDSTIWTHLRGSWNKKWGTQICNPLAKKETISKEVQDNNAWHIYSLPLYLNQGQDSIWRDNKREATNQGEHIGPREL